MNRHTFNAAQCIKQGGVIAYPTSTVMGLGCDPFNQEAVQRLLTIKCRPEHKGLIVIAADFKQILPFLSVLTKEQLSTLNASWPGPNTWLVPNQYFPHWVTGKFNTVALRVDSHPTTQQLCKLTGPIISTSANLSGGRPAQSLLTLAKPLRDKLDYVIPAVGRAITSNIKMQTSSIRDLCSGNVIR